MNIFAFASRCAKTSAALAITSSVAVAAASRAETGSPFAAINAIAHIVDGDDVGFPTAYAPRETRIGLAVNATAMASWAVIYEALFGRSAPSAKVAGGFATSLLAYIIDYHMVPKRYTPGIERCLSKQAIFWIYVVLAFTFAASPAWNSKDVN